MHISKHTIHLSSIFQCRINKTIARNICKLHINLKKKRHRQNKKLTYIGIEWEGNFV